MHSYLAIDAGLTLVAPGMGDSKPNRRDGLVARSRELPLVVDLDGTLIKTDLLHEGLSAALLTQPLAFFRILGWLAKGPAHLKERLADAVQLDPSTLPYRSDLLEWLKQQRASGRYIVLATAADSQIAGAVAGHLGLFDEVVSSEGGHNLKAEAKRDALVKRFGVGGFAYIGDARCDLDVWEVASAAHVAGHAPRLTGLLRRRGKLERVFDEHRVTVGALLQAMRPTQWSKNLLILVPLLASHRFLDPAAVASALLAMFVFAVAASGVYIMNDLVDLEHDRHHPRKRMRPLASGALPVLIGWAVWPLLLGAAATIAANALPIAFAGWLLMYVGLTLAYSFWLKREPIADVVTLALLYTLRIIAGAAAIGVPLTFWLLSFSIFLFLSLALIKRFIELRAAHDHANGAHLRGRGYGPRDLDFVAILGGCAGYTSVLVLGLYVHDPRTASMYPSPEFIWLACPIFLAWISRAWLLAFRGEMQDDPVVFAVKDRISWLLSAMFALAFALASVLP